MGNTLNNTIVHVFLKKGSNFEEKTARIKLQIQYFEHKLIEFGHRDNVCVNWCVVLMIRKKSALLLRNIVKHSIEASSRRCFCSIVSKRGTLLDGCNFFQTTTTICTSVQVLLGLHSYIIAIRRRKWQTTADLSHQLLPKKCSSLFFN